MRNDVSFYERNFARDYLLTSILHRQQSLFQSILIEVLVGRITMKQGGGVSKRRKRGVLSTKRKKGVLNWMVGRAENVSYVE